MGSYSSNCDFLDFDVNALSTLVMVSRCRVILKIAILNIIEVQKCSVIVFCYLAESASVLFSNLSNSCSISFNSIIAALMSDVSKISIETRFPDFLYLVECLDSTDRASCEMV